MQSAGLRVALHPARGLRPVLLSSSSVVEDEVKSMLQQQVGIVGTALTLLCNSYLAFASNDRHDPILVLWENVGSSCDRDG